MTEYLTSASQYAPYMPFPKFLLGMDLPDSAKLIYVLMLNRAGLSMRNADWQDDTGHVFISYTIADLGADLGKSEMTVKNGLHALQEADLIERQPQGVGKASRIFLKVPSQAPAADRFLSAAQTEIDPHGRQFSILHADRKLSGNKTNRTKQYSKNDYVCEEYESL